MKTHQEDMLSLPLNSEQTIVYDWVIFMYVYVAVYNDQTAGI